MSLRTTSRLIVRRVALAMCAALPFVTGCLGYGNHIAIDDQHGFPARLAREDIDGLSAAIERRIEPLAMVRHPEIDGIRKDSTNGAEFDFVIVDEWIRAPRERGGDDVRVYVKRNKGDDAVSVVIVNRTWPRPTELTNAIEAAVAIAISESLPGYQVLVEQRSEGVFFP